MRAETRQRILDIAHSLGYRPSAAAAAVWQGRTGSLGLITSPVVGASYMPPTLLRSLQIKAARQDLDLLLGNLDPSIDFGSRTELPRLLRQRVCDGLLLNFTHAYPPALAEFIDHYHVPSIWLNARRGSDCVYPDDRLAARRATADLLARGFRHVIYVNEMPGGGARARDAHFSETERRAGYEMAMTEAGLAPVAVERPRAASEAAAFDAPGALKAAVATLQLPVAVLCYHRGADQVIDLLRAGYDVPRDVLVVSFSEDGFSLPRRMPYVPVPVEQLAEQAISQLLTRIANDNVSLSPLGVPYGDIDWNGMNPIPSR